VPVVALEISLLGPPRVARDGEAVSFDTRKATALLAHLALAERPRSREALCELLWPGRDTEHARAALRRTLSTLRSAVGEEWLETEGDSVALRRGAGLELDVARFRALAEDGDSTERLAAAVELSRGELLEGFALRDSPDFDAWQIEQADLIRRELATTLGRLVRLLAERGEPERAISHARRWLELEPLHEPAHRELIRLYAWSGDRGAALRQYRDCVRTLSQELGVAPLEETAALFEQVSEGTLAPPSASAARRVDPPPVAGGPVELPLVGRTAELEELGAAHRAAAEDGHLAVAEGEAGIGKTRLASELLASAREAGAVVLAARCHDDEAGLPYAPVAELLSAALASADEWAEAVSPQRLADASLLLPELAGARPELPAPLSPSEPAAQARLLEGVSAVIAAACHGELPGVVFVDDVHAADSATLDVLAYLARRLGGRPLLLLLTWRSDALAPDHRLRRITSELARSGAATVIRLGRLWQPQVAELVRSMSDGGAELERGVYLESEGLPLLVAEYLGALRTDEDAAGAGLRTEVRSIFGARLAGLSDIARQVLGAAAVIGRTFGLDVVRAASGRTDDEAVAGLEELLARDIVRELAPEAGYDFVHQKLREFALEEMSLARRQLLHRRVAGALPRTAETAALVANHLRLAGEHAEAAEQYRRAAEHSMAVVALPQALEQLEAALALGLPERGALLERIGDVRTLLGDYAGALAAYEGAAAESDGDGLAAVEQKLGGVHARRGEWERSEARFEAALEAASSDSPGLRARIMADLALTLHHADRSGEAARRAEEALELARLAGDPRARAQAHNMLGVLARSEGELARARTELEQSLALADELADAPARAAALNNLALVERDAGQLERALELTEMALRRCAASGDRHREAALENNLADLHQAAGRSEAAMDHLKRAVAIFSEVGADEATRLPEIWKLVSW
jgi:DNA-binding SARP family transcriptional activator/predicted ATPase